MSMFVQLVCKIPHYKSQTIRLSDLPVISVSLIKTIHFRVNIHIGLNTVQTSDCSAL